MNEQTIPKVILLLAGIAIFCAGISMILCFTEDSNDDDSTVQYRLYIGFDIDSTESEIQSYKTQIIDRLALDGVWHMTYDAEGGYISDGGSVSKKTMILILQWVDLDYVQSVVDFCKEIFSTSEVLVESAPVHAEYH